MELHLHGHDPRRRPPGGLLIDCDSCVVRGDACGDCVVTHLLGGPPEPLELDRDELGALDALAGVGMVPPLRLVTAVSSHEADEGDDPTDRWSDVIEGAP
ncbi:MAG: hypothetical protein H0V13_10285 [Nocardioidaceae bacterium]|jgi:hypothetical protein|nr:hypothetical protein [Nocardioidaceae bacterium]